MSSQSPHAAELAEAVQAGLPVSIADLSDLVRIPSVSWDDFDHTHVRTSAEAVAATLYIVGEKEQAHTVLAKFNWGEQFLVLNKELLERYSSVETSQEVVAIQWDYCEPPKDEKAEDA